MEKAEEETQANFQKKRGVAAQKKEAKLEKEEAEKYQKLTQQLVSLFFSFKTKMKKKTKFLIEYYVIA